MRDTTQGMLVAQVMIDCEKYHGLPMVAGKSKVHTFKGLKEKITKLEGEVYLKRRTGNID